MGSPLDIEQLRNTPVWLEMQEILKNFIEEHFPGATLDDLVYTIEENEYVITYNGRRIAEIGITESPDDLSNINLN